MTQRLRKRMDALEARSGGFKPWHFLFVQPGETVEQAQAAYEAEHGPIGEDDCFIMRPFEDQKGQTT